MCAIGLHDHSARSARDDFFFLRTTVVRPPKGRELLLGLRRGTAPTTGHTGERGLCPRGIHLMIPALGPPPRPSAPGTPWGRPPKPLDPAPSRLSGAGSRSVQPRARRRRDGPRPTRPRGGGRSTFNFGPAPQHSTNSFDDARSPAGTLIMRLEAANMFGFVWLLFRPRQHWMGSV